MAKDFNDYPVALWQYLFCFIMLFIFVYLGFKDKRFQGTKIYSPSRLWIFSSPFIIIEAVIFYTLSMRGVNWLIILTLGMTVYFIYYHVFSGIDWSKTKRTHYVAIASGFVSGLLPFVAIQAGKDPAKILNLVSCIGFILSLIIYYNRIKKEENI